MAPVGSRTTIWLFVLVTILAGLLLVLVGFHTQLMSTLQLFSHEPGLDPKLGAQVSPLTLPIKKPKKHYELPRTSTVFRERPILEDLSIAADDAWKEVALTRKGGFLWVESNQTSKTPYGISMFHGLHCLQMLRIVIRNSPMMQDVVESGSDDILGSRMGSSKAGHLGMDPVHIGHCIGYIAQHLMCAADSTIEMPWTTLDEHGQIIDSGVDGEGYQHQCRDSALLWETATNSEKTAVKPWRWQQGDTIESVFGTLTK